MAQNLFKKKAHKVMPNKSPREEPPKVVLVGTYKGEQLEKWPGYYNYPLTSKDCIDVEFAKKVNEVWLFKGAKDGRFYAAEFVGQFTRDELKTRFAYPARGKGHGERYLLYKISETEVYDPASGLVDAVIVRSADFATAPKIRHQIKEYLSSPDRKDQVVAKLVPRILTQVPQNVLRVCDVGVQLDFLMQLGCQLDPFSVKKNAQKSEKLTCLDFFAGSGLVSSALDGQFETVWANDISQKKAIVFNANIKKRVLDVRPIETVDGHCLPSVDLSWGSFPCQDLSLAGDMDGLYASRSGLFWQWLRVMDEMPQRPPVVVAENVVGLVSAEGGKYYVAAHEELAKRGYNVGAVMLDAVHWVPQSRKRIFVVAARKDIDVSPFVGKGPDWCHPDPVINVAGKVEKWIWWKLPQPQERSTSITDIIDFDAPCDAQDEQTAKLRLVPVDKMNLMREQSESTRSVYTGYRRTRNHKQVLEVRMDGIAGCLRTPCGGSSRQIVLIADHGQIRTRLLTVRETARLMGAPDTFLLPGSYNDGYMAMGDGVAFPVAKYLSEQLLAPIAKMTK